MFIPILSVNIAKGQFIDGFHLSYTEGVLAEFTSKECSDRLVLGFSLFKRIVIYKVLCYGFDSQFSWKWLECMIYRRVHSYFDILEVSILLSSFIPPRYYENNVFSLCQGFTDIGEDQRRLEPLCGRTFHKVASFSIYAAFEQGYVEIGWFIF